MSPNCLVLGLISLCFAIKCAGGNERCAASIRGACPPAWSQWGEKCYRKLSETLPWAEAKQECIKMGSVLVMPQSLEETDFLQINIAPRFWIDCNDLETEGSWECREGTRSVTFRNWQKGQPSNSRSNNENGENCVVVLQETAGLWNDWDCTWAQVAVCTRSTVNLHL